MTSSPTGVPSPSLSPILSLTSSEIASTLSLPAKVVYPAPPPTTNSLTGAQRSQLLKSTKKIGKLLGSTPYLVDDGPVMVHLPFGGRDSPLVRRSVESSSSSGSLSSNEEVGSTKSTLERALSLKSSTSSSSGGSYATTRSARSMNKFSTIAAPSDYHLPTADAFDTQPNSKSKAKPPMLRLAPPHNTAPITNSFPLSRTYSATTLTSSRRRSRASAKIYFSTDDFRKDLPDLPLPDEMGHNNNEIEVFTAIVTPASPASPTSSTTSTGDSSIGDTETSGTDESDLLPIHTPYTLRPKSANTAAAGRDSVLSPPSFVIPTTTALRRQKMERLQRKLGETSIPFDLVFPELTRDSEKGDHKSIAIKADLSTPPPPPPFPQPLSSTPSTPLCVAIPRPTPPPNHGKIAHARDSLASDASPHKAKRRSTSPRPRTPSMDEANTGGSTSPKKAAFEVNVLIKASRPAPPPPAGGSSKASRKPSKGEGRKTERQKARQSMVTISMAGVSPADASSSHSSNKVLPEPPVSPTTPSRNVNPSTKTTLPELPANEDDKRIVRTSSLEVILEFPDHEGEVQVNSAFTGAGGYRQRVAMWNHGRSSDMTMLKGALARSASTPASGSVTKRWFSQFASGKRRGATPTSCGPQSSTSIHVDLPSAGPEVDGTKDVLASDPPIQTSCGEAGDSSMMVNPKRRSWTTRKPPPALIPELSLGLGDGEGEGPAFDVSPPDNDVLTSEWQEAYDSLALKI